MEPNTCHRTPPRQAPPGSGGENGTILALPPIPGRHRMSPNPQERSPAQARNAGSGSKPSLSFPRGKPGLPLGSSEMGDCQKSCRALRPEKPAPTPQPRTRRPRVAGKSGLGVPDPSSRRPPSPRTRPPCERCLPPAASRSPRRRPGRPASPRGSSPPAARAVPAWKPRPAQVPPRRCARSPAVLSSRVAGAGRLKGRGAEPSVRNLSLPNRRPRRSNEQQSEPTRARGRRARVGRAPSTRPRSLWGMRSPLATALTEAARPGGVRTARAPRRPLSMRKSWGKRKKATPKRSQPDLPGACVVGSLKRLQELAPRRWVPPPRQQGALRSLSEEMFAMGFLTRVLSERWCQSFINACCLCSQTRARP